MIEGSGELLANENPRVEIDEAETKQKKAVLAPFTFKAPAFSSSRVHCGYTG